MVVSTGARPSPLPRKKGPTGGTGKKRKVFSEDLGSSHLLSLAANVGTSEESKRKDKVDKNKERVRALKEKRKEDAKTRSSTQSQQQSSRSAIRAQLKAKTRERAKSRKDKRKAGREAAPREEEENTNPAAVQTVEEKVSETAAPAASPSSPSRPRAVTKRKSVTFAFPDEPEKRRKEELRIQREQRRAKRNERSGEA